MRPISLKHPTNPVVVTARNMTTYNALKAAGWQVVPHPVTVVKGERLDTSELSK